VDVETVRELEVKNYIVGAFAPDLAAAELDSGYDLLENGVIRSLDLLRLVSWISERYSIPMAGLAITPRDFSSVDAIGAFIDGHSTD
jgi:acyl carrier protein